MLEPIKKIPYKDSFADRQSNTQKKRKPVSFEHNVNHGSVQIGLQAIANASPNVRHTQSLQAMADESQRVVEEKQWQEVADATTSLQFVQDGSLPTGGELPVQFAPAWKIDNHPDGYMDGFVGVLDGLVRDAAREALNPSDLPDLDGYVALWKDTAIILKAIEDGEIDQEDSDEVAEANAAKSFAAARYGYAIESLACSKAGALTAALPVGCSYQLQASRGMTRPDIVVRHVTDGEIAWLDITSSGSKGHIDRKTGSGWQTKKYVAEILYDPLNPSDIGTGTMSIGAKVARRNAMKRRIKVWENVQKDFRKEFNRKWDENDGTELTSKSSRSDLARNVVGEILGGGRPSPQETKSVIRAVAWSIKDYGFDSGGTKAEGESILRNIYGA
ncbi:MAG: hypothetical protein AAFX87_11375 [Bacteroidota bacterium]